MTNQADVLRVAPDKLAVPQVFLKEGCDRVLFVMRYAISSSTDIFHWVTKSEDKTLCGLNVAPIVINRPATSSTLYLTEIVESDRRLCEKCAASETETKNRAL
jgi:hypothetical protein